MKNKNTKIPRGWLDYSSYGDKVEGTRLFPFKTPLKLELTQYKIPENEWFTPAMLMDNCPNLRAIIDLTDTDEYADRYYSPQEFTRANVLHRKIRISGGGVVPGMDKIGMFSDAVDEFVEKFSDDPDALIGVHCTHGLNRTGYFICKYMVTRMRFDPSDAITRFQNARGYEIHRQNYVDAITQPGLSSGAPQKPDYRRHQNTVRPVVSSHSAPVNWRSRNPEVQGASSSFKSFRNNARMHPYINNRTTSTVNSRYGNSYEQRLSNERFYPVSYERRFGFPYSSEEPSSSERCHPPPNERCNPFSNWSRHPSSNERGFPISNEKHVPYSIPPHLMNHSLRREMEYRSPLEDDSYNYNYGRNLYGGPKRKR